MASFCQQCSINIFGKDYGDMKGKTTQEAWAAHRAAQGFAFDAHDEVTAFRAKRKEVGNADYQAEC